MQKLIMTSSTPNQLHIYDPVLHSDLPMALPKAPVALGVSPDGTKAAVGYTREIVYIDLATRTVLGTYPVSYDFTDLLATNSYIFYWNNSGYMSGSVSLSSGTEMTFNLQLRSARLLDDGISVVGLSSYGDPLLRYTISEGKLVAENASHTDSFSLSCGPIWAPPGANRIYSSCGTIFRSWPAGTAYPSHVTTIPWISALAAPAGSEYIGVAHFAGQNSSVPDSSLTIYRASRLEPVGKIGMTPFASGNTQVAPLIRGVFAGAQAGVFYVLTQAASGGIQEDFRLETADINAQSSCSASVDVTNVDAAGYGDRYTSSVNGLAGCQAKVTTETPWIKISTGPWVPYGGKVTWITGANLTGTSRTGKVTVADQQITVTQPPLAALPAITPVGVTVVDSAYSSALDRLVLAASAPNEVDLYNPTTGAMVSIPISLTPQRLALSSDGLTAIVAHDGWVTYVNLSSGSVIRTVETRTDAGAIVNTTAGYSFILPVADRGVITRIRDMDGALTRIAIPADGYSYSVPGGFVSAALTSDQTTIYASGSNGVTRISISGDTATITGSNYAGCTGSIWLSQDDQRMATSCGLIYRLRPDWVSLFGESFSYPDTGSAQSMSHSLRLHSTAVLSYYNSNNRLQLFGDAAADRALLLNLPQMADGTGTRATLGKAVYWAANPTRLISIVQSMTDYYTLGGYGVHTLNVGVTSQGCNGLLSPTTASAGFSLGTGSATLSIGSECGWEAQSSADWLTVSSSNVGQGTNTITYSVAPNPTFSARSASITVAGKTLTVTQASGKILLSPENATISIAGVSEASIAVTASSSALSWTATANAPWITIQSGAAGTGPGTVTYAVTANPGPSERTGTITIDGATFTVTQKMTYAAPTGLAASDNVTLNWSAVAGAPPSYRLMVAPTADAFPTETSSIACATCVVNTTVNGTAYGIGAGVLVPSTTYYWRVNARNGNFTGEWSAVAQFQTDAVKTEPTVVFRMPNGEMAWSRRGDSALSLSGGRLGGDPAVTRHPKTGELWVAVRDEFNGLWLNSVSITGQWGQWKPLGGVAQGTPAAAVTSAGSLFVVTRDQYNSYWLVTYSISAQTGTWTHLGGVFSSDPAVAAATDGSIRIVGRDNWGGLWSQQRSAAGQLSGWNFGGGITQGTPSVAFGTDGKAYIAARDTARTIWTTYVSPSNVWGPWQSTGGLSESSPQMLPPSNGQLAIAIVDPNGASWARKFSEGPTNWEAWRSYSGIVTSMAAQNTPEELTAILAGFDSQGNLWWSNGMGWSKWITPVTGTGAVVAPR